MADNLLCQSDITAYLAAQHCLSCRRSDGNCSRGRKCERFLPCSLNPLITQITQLHINNQIYLLYCNGISCDHLILGTPPFPGQDNLSLQLDDIRYKIFKVYMQRKMQILTISIFIIIIQKICFITEFLTSEHQVCFRWWYKRWHAVSDLIKSIQDFTSISEYFCLLQHEFNLDLATYMYKDVLEWKL